MPGPRIQFVVDAGPQVGGGHVMRSLTLANALSATGADCGFAGPPDMADMLAAFAPDMPRLIADRSGPREIAEALETAPPFDAIVFDHYGLSETDHIRLRKGRPAMAMDDLADRPLGVDLVVDAGPGRRAGDYDGLVPEGAGLLLGPTFAPVRPEFAALRDKALAWRGEPVQRILVSLGLTDVGGITGRIVERLRPRIGGDIALDVVLGGEAPSLANLEKLARRDTRITLHVDTPRMAQLTAEADIGIGGAGSSTWERCVLGLPSILIVLAANQRPAAETLSGRDAAIVIDAAAADFDGALDRGLMRLLTDAGLRRRLAVSSSEICDGRGAERVADAFLKRIAAVGPRHS